MKQGSTIRFRFVILSLGLFALLASCSTGEAPLSEPIESVALEPAAFTSNVASVSSGKCLEIPQGKKERGTLVRQWTCSDRSRHQRFSFHPVKGKKDSYILRSTSTGLCADVSLSRKASGNTYLVHQWACHGLANQQFQLQRVRGKTFKLVTQHSKKCFDLKGSSGRNGASMHDSRCHGKSNQQWTIAGFSGSNPAPNPPAPNPPAPNPPAPNPGGGVERDILALVNNVRRSGYTCGSRRFAPTSPLTLDTRLNRAARKHSEDMRAAKNMSHTTPQGAIHYRPGSSPWDRMKAEGYSFRGAGENIAWGYRSAKSVVEGWLSSPGHCGNIMSPGYKQLGVGRADTYWTQVFASPR